MTSNYYNILLVGDSGVGKTTLVNKLTCNNYEEGVYQPTYGLNISKYCYYDQKELFTIMFWEVGGFSSRRIRRALPSNIDAAIVMFSLDSSRSFKMAQKWHRIITRLNIEVPIIVYANKSDRTQYVLKDHVDCHRSFSLRSETIFEMVRKDLTSLWQR